MPPYMRTNKGRLVNRKRFNAAKALSSMARTQTVKLSRQGPISSTGQAPIYPRRGNKTEIKCIDTLIQNISFDSAGAAATCIPVNLTAQGNTLGTRAGNSISNLEIILSGEVQGPTSALAVLPQACRIVVFWDRQPRGVNAIATDIFNVADQSALINFASKDRFQIISDRRFVVGQVSTNPAVNNNVPPVKIINWKASLKGIETVINGAAGTIATTTTNPLYVLLMGDQPNLATANPLSNFQVRVFFVDP